ALVHLKLRLEVQHAPPRKRNQDGTGGHHFQVPRVLSQFDWRKPFVLHYLERNRRRARQPLDEVSGVRRADDVNLRRTRLHQRASPGPAAIRVGQHLCLVDYDAVAALLRVEHLDGGGSHFCARDRDEFLARKQIAADATLVEAVKYLEGQQPQRREVPYPGG